jgi:glutamate 5-kinase
MKHQFTHHHDTYVIKAGTDALCDNGKPNENIMRRLAYQMAKLREQARIILVSSGAIGTGRSLLPRKIAKEMWDKKQALSGLGQNDLMGRWTRYFASHGIRCAQGLVEENDFETDDGRRNMRRTFRQYHEIEDAWGTPIIPIINGNDFVTLGPIGNDNDRIAAKIAVEVDALHLVILSDIDGLYTGDPDDKSSELIRRVHAGHYNWRKHVSKGKKSKNGTGGFDTKGAAAEEAALADVLVHIGNSRSRNAIQRLLQGTIGTTFYK